MKKGIDISYHQGAINFDLAKKDGVEFVIIREGYRNKTDARFFEYVNGAKEAGIVILGVYHFSYALNPSEAMLEAKLCVENIKKAGLGKNIMVFFDFEYDTVKKALQKGIGLFEEDCCRHTEAFCEEIKRSGYVPGVYTNLDYYKNWYNQEILKKYPIWLADYKGEPDYKCLIHQYSESGKVNGIKNKVDMNYYYGEEFKMNGENKRSRNEVVKLARSWVGKKESDGSFKSIIDTYNSHTPRPRGVKMTYTAPWCATFWSALAISLGYTDIMPIECSCGELIKKAKEMDIWVEDDSYMALPGDAILYDWEDDGKGDNVGWPDHVGVIEKVSNGSFAVIEGNKNDAVGRRTVKVDAKFIRGFIAPKYDDVEKPTENLSKKTKWVVTAHSLNVRENPTTSSRSLKVLREGTEVVETGNAQDKWVEIKIPGSNMVGWCSKGTGNDVYLKRV